MIENFTTSEIKKMHSVKIGISGCGGLGSNTAMNLVRLGFKKFLLVDFDIINKTNLNRQFYFYNQVGLFKTDALKENLLLINPNLEIETKNIIVNRQNINNIFKDCEIVVEGFDNTESKILLIETLTKSKKCVVGNGLGNYWKVDKIITKKMNNNLTLVGDFKSDTDQLILPQCPGVSISSGKQAAVVLEMVLGGIKCLD